MLKNLLSLAVIFACIVTVNAQINLEGNTGNQAVDVQWTGTTASDKTALNSYSIPSASYGYGIKTIGGYRGIYAQCGNPNSNLRTV
jgi:hypothetical protein